jgi:hypothetical protein
MVMVDHADDLHSRLGGRASPDGRAAGIVTPEDQFYKASYRQKSFMAIFLMKRGQN